MRVKRRFSTRWGHPYHLQGACAKCRQTLLRPLCFITSMSPESYMEWPAQSKGEDPSVVCRRVPPRDEKPLRELGQHNGDKAGCLSVGSVAIASGKCLLLPGDTIIPNNLTMPPGV